MKEARVAFEHDSNPSDAKPKGHHLLVMAFWFGGDGGIRTLDLTDANRTLSQLSYAPIYDSSAIIAHFFVL